MPIVPLTQKLCQNLKLESKTLQLHSRPLFEEITLPRHIHNAILNPYLQEM